MAHRQLLTNEERRHRGLAFGRCGTGRQGEPRRVDERAAEVVDHLVARRAGDRPRPPQGLVSGEYLLDDDGHPACQAVEARQVAGGIGETVDVVDP